MNAPKPGRCIECDRKSDTLICDRCYRPIVRRDDAQGEFLAAYKHNGQSIPRAQGVTPR